MSHNVWWRGTESCVYVCVSSRNRTPTQPVRQPAKETNSSPRHQDRPASPIPATPNAANTHRLQTHTACIDTSKLKMCKHSTSLDTKLQDRQLEERAVRLKSKINKKHRPTAHLYS